MDRDRGETSIRLLLQPDEDYTATEITETTEAWTRSSYTL